jgi:hypothetical protein
VNINLNVLFAAMMNRVGRHVNGADLSHSKQPSRKQSRYATPEVTIEASNSMGNSSILGLSTGAGDTA